MWWIRSPTNHFSNIMYILFKSLVLLITYFWFSLSEHQIELCFPMVCEVELGQATCFSQWNPSPLFFFSIFKKICLFWRRQWHPTPIFLLGKSHGDEEPGGLQSMGSLRVGHDWATSLSLFTFMYWRRKWQPTPVFLPGESQEWGSLVGCHLWQYIHYFNSAVYICIYGLPWWLRR